MGPSPWSKDPLVGVGGGVSCRKALDMACICHGEGVEAGTCPCSKGHRDLCKGPCMGALDLWVFHGIYNQNLKVSELKYLLGRIALESSWTNKTHSDKFHKFQFGKLPNFHYANKQQHTFYWQNLRYTYGPLGQSFDLLKKQTNL